MRGDEAMMTEQNSMLTITRLSYLFLTVFLIFSAFRSSTAFAAPHFSTPPMTPLWLNSGDNDLVLAVGAFCVDLFAG